MTVSNAFIKLTIELLKPTRLVANELEVWILLEEIGLGDDAIVEAYVYPVNNPKKLKALLTSLEARCKNVFKLMMQMSNTTM